jgi:hypothetical protein
MTSDVFTRAQGGARQLTLPLDETLLSRHRSLRDCVAQGVYQRGVTWVAGQLDESPGNLSSQLSDKSERKFDVDALVRYIECTGDKTPIYWLIARFLGDEGAARDQALAQVVDMLGQLQGQLPAMMAAAGLQHPQHRGGRGR